MWFPNGTENCWGGRRHLASALVGNEPDPVRLEHEALGDICRAKEARPELDAGLEEVPAETDAAATRLAVELGIQIRVMARDEVADLLLGICVGWLTSHSRLGRLGTRCPMVPSHLSEVEFPRETAKLAI